MKYPWIDEYLLAKRGVSKDLQPEWNWIRYQIGGRMFAAVCLDPEDRPYYITLKLDPVEGEFWRGQYADILPGYYMNKLHWNSVRADGEVPDEVLRQMLDRAWQAVLKDFGKQKQREILGLSVCGTDCAACPLYGTRCEGCNETNGKVFHMSDGKPCSIFACCVRRHRFATCAACGQLPCTVWQETRDPAMTEEQFQTGIEERVRTLRKCGSGDPIRPKTGMGENAIPSPAEKPPASDDP